MLEFDMGAAEHSALLLGERASLMDFRMPRQDELMLDIQHFAPLDMTVITKPRPGFDKAQIQALRNLVRDIANGTARPCKFLVFDLAHDAKEAPRPGSSFDDLISDVSDLIFEAPVVSIAWARRAIAGPDLELALACSMIVGETDATFAFGTDLVDCLRSYSLLAHKVGFVQAERLMESGERLSAEQMRDLLLLQAVVPAAPGNEGIERFVKARTRRHNSACGIYRAQRIAMLGA